MLEIRIGAFRAEAHSAENPRYRSRILLVHGLWGGSWCWRHYGSFLAHRGWELIAADLRGRPGGPPARIRRIRIADYLSDVTDLIRSDTLNPPGSDPPILIGHDLGALLALSARHPVRAIVAMAPPFAVALTDRFRALLAGRRRWPLGSLHPPRSIPEEPEFDASRLQEDSGHVARAILAGEISFERPEIPVLVVGGTRDPFLDRNVLESESMRLGAHFLDREAGHWGLEASGFERQVDRIHRWLVQELGTGMLRLSGFEDLDDDES